MRTDAFFADRVGQGRLVHELAPRGIHEHRRWFHELQPLGVDQVMGLLGVGHVERDHVRLAEQLVERQQLQLQLGGALR